MDLKLFIDNIRTQFDETDPSLITEETDFKSLDEWSSLVAMGVIAMIDEEYGVEIKGDDIRASLTIQDLYKIVLSKS